jgi:hypothetical protein
MALFADVKKLSTTDGHEGGLARIDDNTNSQNSSDATGFLQDSFF